MSAGGARQSPDNDLSAAVERLAAVAAPGALLRVEAEQSSLADARAAGLERDAEGLLLRRAWRALTRIVPPQSARKRTGWARCEWVVAGDRAELEALGCQMLALLVLDGELSTVCWHVVLTAIVPRAAQRTLCCDPGYDLRAVARRRALVWVTPYEGADWTEPQRYPKVHLIASPGAGDAGPAPAESVGSARERALGYVEALRRHLARFAQVCRARHADGETPELVQDLFASLLEVSLCAREAVPLEVTPCEPPPHRRLDVRAAVCGLLDPALVTSIREWQTRGHVVFRQGLAHPAGSLRQLAPVAIDFAKLARSVELGRCLSPHEERSIVDQMREELAWPTPLERSDQG